MKSCEQKVLEKYYDYFLPDTTGMRLSIYNMVDLASFFTINFMLSNNSSNIDKLYDIVYQ
jgi:hypothetical protein